jgi:hypothetical protein
MILNVAQNEAIIVQFFLHKFRSMCGPKIKNYNTGYRADQVNSHIRQSNYYITAIFFFFFFFLVLQL